MRRYILSLLVLASVAAVARIGVSLWPQAAADAGMTPLAMVAAEAKEAAETAPRDEALTTMDRVSVIGEAKASVFPGIPGESLPPEEIEVLRNLKGVKKDLDARAKALDAREEAVREGEARAAKRIAELEALEARIQERLDMESSISDKKIKRLAAVYENMKADKAAPVIARMDLPTVVKVFSRMQEKKVGKILSFLPPQQAVTISQALTQRISALEK